MSVSGAAGGDGTGSLVIMCGRAAHPYSVPVVVTPLLPDDPKVGETWLAEHGLEVTVLGPVTVDNQGVAWVECSLGISPLEMLRRPPVMKTFRLHSPRGYFELEAESREAALATLAAGLEKSLEEVVHRDTLEDR
jgi:hypothetical protein